jgi:glutathione S-transferase
LGRRDLGRDQALSCAAQSLRPSPLWLLEELGLPYELHAAPLEPPAPRPFAQKTPSGKVPTIEDDGVTIFESGAIVEYLLEKYGSQGLAPSVGSPLRGPFLQWVHFADATAFTGLGNIAWHTRFKEDAESVADALADYRGWAEASLDALERTLRDRDFLLGAELRSPDGAPQPSDATRGRYTRMRVPRPGSLST